MISSRPRSIVNESTSFESGERKPKLHVGPTRPRPGPTLLMQVRDAVKAEVKSSSSSETISAEKKRMIM